MEEVWYIPRKTNWAQKHTTPKNEKFTVILSRKVLTTLGVHTFLAAWDLDSSVQGRIRFV